MSAAITASVKLSQKKATLKSGSKLTLFIHWLTIGETPMVPAGEPMIMELIIE